MSESIKIERIEIKYVRRDNSLRKDIEGLHHIKSLPWLSVVQSVEGSYEITLGEGATENTGTGGFFIAPSHIKQDILHRSDPITRKMYNRWVFLDVVINGKYRLEYIYDFPVILPEAYKKTMNDLFDELFSTSDICDQMSIYYQIVKTLLSVGRIKETAGDESLFKALDYIHDNYRNAMSVSDIAQTVLMSESNFYSRFKKQFGMSPIAFLNHYRLTLASDMLKQSNATIKEIAESVGFFDQLYFSKLFKRTFNVSPRQYRDRY